MPPRVHGDRRMPQPFTRPRPRRSARAARRSCPTSSARSRSCARALAERRAARLVLEQRRRARRRARRSSPGGTSTPVSSVMTAPYPGMSDATTGTAHANAARQHHAEALLPDRRHGERLRAQQLRGQLLLRAGSRGCRCRSSRSGAARAASCTASGSAPTSRSRAPVRRWIVGPRLQQHRHPLARVVAADEDDRVARGWPGRPPAGSARRSGSPRSPSGTPRAAPRPAPASETAIRVVDPVEQEAPEVQPARIQPSSPAACQVATIGQLRDARASTTQIAGVIGSCRWRTSKLLLGERRASA